MIKIKIWGDITLQTSSVVESSLSEISDTSEPVLILINSPGGTLTDATAICNLLSAIPNPIITVAIGTCQSAAVMIFLCGTSRYTSKDLDFMIHQPYIPKLTAPQNYSFSKELSAGLKKDLDIYKKYITRNTEIPKEVLDIAFKYGNDLEISSQDALKYKIATNMFTTWNSLYKKEHISSEEKILLYDVLMMRAED